MNNQPEPDEGSAKPYLLRAIYEWAVDHRLTPQVLVDAGVEGVVVPADFIKDGRIVLTIHPRSVQDLQMGNEYLQFSARFAGKPFAVCIPVPAIAAIYCRENSRGFVFQADERAHDHANNQANAQSKKMNQQKPQPVETTVRHLKLVK